MTNSIYAPRIVAAIPKPLAGTTETSNLYSNLSMKRLHSRACSDRRPNRARKLIEWKQACYLPNSIPEPNTECAGSIKLLET